MENNAKNITISQSEYEDLKTRCTELEQQVQFFMEQLRLSRHKQFGSASEKSEYDQISLFNEAEAEADTQNPDPELTTVEAQPEGKPVRAKTVFFRTIFPWRSLSTRFRKTNRFARTAATICMSSERM